MGVVIRACSTEHLHDVLCEHLSHLARQSLDERDLQFARSKRSNLLAHLLSKEIERAIVARPQVTVMLEQDRLDARTVEVNLKDHL